MDTPLLLTELHAHSDWSDGTLSLSALVDLYGEHGFDVLCVTDHTVRNGEANRSFVGMHNWRDYLDAVDAEAERALARYGMLVVPGLELTDDHDDRLRSAHALVFPSEWYEALPVTILEAFACGLPVIAADRGAAGEIVRHGHTGLHFSPGDDHALEAQLSWAGRNPDALRSMGLAARQEYEAKYTAESNYGRLLEIYRLAIQKAETA